MMEKESILQYKLSLFYWMNLLSVCFWSTGKNGRGLRLSRCAINYSASLLNSAGNWQRALSTSDLNGDLQSALISICYSNLHLSVFSILFLIWSQATGAKGKECYCQLSKVPQNIRHGGKCPLGFHFLQNKHKNKLKKMTNIKIYEGGKGRKGF